jgi:hypothetical protein
MAQAALVFGIVFLAELCITGYYVYLAKDKYLAAWFCGMMIVGFNNWVLRWAILDPDLVWPKAAGEVMGMTLILGYLAWKKWSGS